MRKKLYDCRSEGTVVKNIYVNIHILISDATKYKQNLVQFERVSNLGCMRACAWCVLCADACVCVICTLW